MPTGMAMHIGHVALRLTDPHGYAQFARDVLGLHETDRTATAILLSASEKHHELELVQGAEDGLDHVGLEVESAETLQTVQAAVERAGITCRRVPQGHAAGLGPAIRFTGPGAIAYEVYTDMSRDSVSIGRYTHRPVRRFGHLTFASAEHHAVENFCVEVLHFRVSDRLGRATWLRCDADHHGFAVAPGPDGTVLHHHAWQTQDLGTLGSYCDGLIGHGLTLKWGPVRHGPGFNLATYLPDPAGGLVEVYADLLQIVDDAGYVPYDWTGEPNALNLWGPPAPDDFLTYGLPTVGFPTAAGAAA
jgi:catechol-2,3-dioxygenase